MATFAARRLQRLIDNTSYILGIELLAAGQALEFLRPLRSSQVLEAAHALLARRLPAPWIAIATWPRTSNAATALVRDGSPGGRAATLPQAPALWPLA
jgi:histidine ammonia-lyase